MMVFGHATVEEARALSATCHYFRDVGLTYIYTTRKICMSSPLNIYKLVTAEEPKMLAEQVNALLAASRDKCIREMTRSPDSGGEEIAQTFSAWNVLALCPNLRLLRVVADTSEDEFDMPDPPFWSHMACIARVEHLHLQGFHWNQLNDLIGWLAHSATSSGGLRMTHLKLYSAWGIPDALGTDTALFDTLGQLFPLLEGLTLVRRANERQRESKLCQWPLPVYEYARHMQGLTRLRHFGANFYREPNRISPAVLRRLEPGYSITDDPDSFGWDHMEEGYSIVLPFAAYCPSLETFAITADWVRYGARIRRSATGAIEIESVESRFRDTEFDEWNPSMHSRHCAESSKEHSWPKFKPIMTYSGGRITSLNASLNAVVDLQTPEDQIKQSNKVGGPRRRRRHPQSYILTHHLGSTFAMYSDTDDEYDEDGKYKQLHLFREAQPHLRLFQSLEYRTKNEMHRKVLEERARLYPNRDRDVEVPSDKEMLRARLEDPSLPAWSDWTRWRAIRFFREIQGFHKGALDLTGRQQSRYEALMRTFWSLASDVQSLAPLVKKIDIQREEVDHEVVEFVMKTVSVPIISDPTVWDTFRTKWKIPRTFDYEDLTDSLQQTYRVLADYPVPRFQRLWITDFPPEVVTIVFEHTTIEEARSMSATCHYFRDVGLTYIYTPLGLSKLRTSEESGTVKQRVHALVAASSDKCIREIDFLVSRPDIRARIRRLSAGDTWSSGLHRDTELGVALRDALAPRAYVRAFMGRFTHLLSQVALESLSLHRLEIDLDLALQVSQQSRLVELDVRYCATPPALWQHILSSPPGSLQSSVKVLRLDLHQGEDFPDTFSAWNLLAFCPNLRLLRVSALNPQNGFDVPETQFWPHMACIARLEYLHLHGLTWAQVDELTDWLAQAATSSGVLHMTHLKLHSAWGIPDAGIGQLLHALRNGQAPLRVLALDGIMGTDATLFDTIGQLFPLLEGLTLVRRANDRQWKPRLCHWPLPVYEYAQRMRGLTRLRHFGANFYWDHGSVSPAVLRRLEPGYSADTDPDHYGWDLMQDGYSVALPFAAHCSALETFAITSDWIMYSARIHRSATGALEIKSLEPRFSDTELDRWNPSTYSMGAWQLPRRNENA
ncbi:hypothetical protein AURDEDRAFT_152765 [Auricularia subglabra TFB-10046 SS5]|nr:hypothetical protein AURDEDRAFT_152765 [Auricularia subglabra TFB-10046 SS5]